MQYFKKSVGEHKNFQKLCERVKFFKESQKWVSIDVIADSIPSLARDFIEELSKKILQPSSV